MARQEFIDQLQNMGYTVKDLGQDRLAFQYTIEVGKYIGEVIQLGLEVKEDFPMTPPSGPHVSPRLLPINPISGEHPFAGVHTSPFGDEWEYWSRPYLNWGNTDRTVRAYLGHIRRLFDTL